MISSMDLSALANFAIASAAITGIAALHLRKNRPDKAPVPARRPSAEHPHFTALHDLSDKIVDTLEEKAESWRPTAPPFIPVELPLALLFGEPKPNGHQDWIGTVFLSKDKSKLILVDTDKKYGAKKNNTFYLTTPPAEYIAKAKRFNCPDSSTPFMGLMADPEMRIDHTQKVSYDDLAWVGHLLKPKKPRSAAPTMIF